MALFVIKCEVKVIEYVGENLLKINGTETSPEIYTIEGMIFNRHISI